MQRIQLLRYIALLVLAALWIPNASAANREVERFGLFETSVQATGRYGNPYTEFDAEAERQRPDGSTRSIPLFWNGGDAWKLRISPDATGEWWTARTASRVSFGPMYWPS